MNSMSFQAKNKAMDKLVQAVEKVWPLKNPLSYTQGLKPYREKKWQEAREYFERAVEEKPGHAPSYFKLGMCHFRLKQYEQARDWIAQALELDPQQSSWKEQLAQTLHHLSKVGSEPEREAFIREQLESIETAALYNELAHALRKQGKWWQEVEALKSAIALEEHHPTWHYRLGEALEVMNRFQEAAAKYGRAIELKNGKADAVWHYRQGYCFEREGHDGPPDPEAADKAHRLAIEKDGKLDAKRFGIGVFHQQRGHWAQAREAYQAKVSQQPWDAELNYKLGMAHDRCYEWEEAEACYKKALTIDMQQLGWHYRLGFVLERQEKFSAAAAAYQYAALNREKHTPYWFYRWAYVLEKQGRYEEAAQAYLQTRQQQTLDAPFVSESAASPEQGTAQMQPAEQNDALSDYADQFDNQQFIIDVLENHLKKDTINPDHWYQLGNAYERQESWGRAADAYQHALSRKNDHTPEWYYRLGYALTQTGQYNEACEALRSTRILQSPHGVSENSIKSNKAAAVVTFYRECFEVLNIDDSLILYESFHGVTMGCNPYGIFKEALGDVRFQDFMHVWVVNSLEVVPEGIKSNKNVVFIARESDAYLRCLASARFLVNNSTFPPYFLKKQGQVYINTWHGTPWKTLGIDMADRFYEHKTFSRNILQCSYILSPNPHTSNVFINSHGVSEAAIRKIRQTGYPRIDVALNVSEARKKKLSQMLNIEGKKTILYAPTYRGDLAKVEFDFDKLLNDIEKMSALGYNVIFRGHTLVESRLSMCSFLDINLAPANIDTNELFSVADILVTDYSSVMFDFLCTGKPCILYTYDYESYLSDRGLYFDIGQLPGIPCYNQSELVNLLEDYDSLVEKHSVCHRYLGNDYSPYEDGCAAARALDLLMGVDNNNWLVPEVKMKSKKRILFYSGPFIPNGITTSSINLLNNIDYSRFEVYLLIDWSSIANHPERIEQLERIPVYVNIICKFSRMNLTLEDRYIHSLFNATYSFCNEEMRNIYYRSFEHELRRVVGDLNYDVAINFEGYMRYWSSLLSNANNNVIYQHNDLFSEMLLRFPYLEAIFASYQKYNKIVSVSKPTMELNVKNLASLANVDASKFIYCENLHDPSYILEKSQEAINPEDKEIFSDNVPVFITLGRLSPEKDHSKLVEAFNLLIKQGYEAKLAILGDGPLKSEIQKKIRLLGLADKVYLLGRRFNPFPLLAKSDCFVMSSNHEGQPMVLIEAMILEKPIISTDITGSRSALEGRYGELVDNSVQGLYQGMSDFLETKSQSVCFDISQYQNEAMSKFENSVID